MNIGNSLQTKMSIVLLTSILSIMITSGIVLYYIQRFELQKEIVNDSKLSFRRLTNSLKEPLWNMDYKETKNIASIEMENHDVLSILVYNDKKERILGYSKDEYFNIIEVSEPPSNHKFLFYEDVITKEGQDIGYLKIYFTDIFLKRSLQILILKLIIQTIILTIISLVVIYFALNVQIINPVILMNRTVGEFANKRFDARIEVKTKDELGSLSENFNNMAKTIQDYSERMEELVAVRTEELRVANDDLLKANDQMKKELQMAQKIQKAIIPKTFPLVNEFEFSGMYIPMDSLGGDYYDVIKISNTKIGMLIADVCGHGVPAALITTMAKVSFASAARENKSAGEIVDQVNGELYKIIGNMEYLTAFFCIVDIEEETIEYTNAGHPSVFIVKKEGNIIELGQNAPIIGFLNDIKFTSDREKLEDGDRIVLYTDGVTEAMNKDGILFDVGRLKKILTSGKDIKISELLEHITKEINHFTEDSEINDDVTMLVGDYFKKR
ncbi:MAG TPA: SpoIIE family protein phosphatase [Spirochaetota bacterium]|nr:MAG: Phosphoserine phosphatase RsbP [Spirochaetes bacterium ADurb.Bin133]HNZ25667.1 SpoIIE family protein phosphatase [Spirochaetota bacterium]HPY86817.1 SpoIIE family protein phosphatase [Spirochaetota bacterium]HQB60612.1 SpoIIE family protein phosphatase [Spirochaetota bacterium]